MSAARALRSHALRPHLSIRYQCLLRRQQSTASKVNSVDVVTSRTTPPPPPPKPSFFRRYRSPLIWGVLSLAFGAGAGNFVLHTISPPPMPVPGSHEDNLLMDDLNMRIDEEFKVKVLRGKCLGVAKQLKGEQGGWVEVVPPSAADPVSSRDLHSGRLIEQLQGAKGLGAERIFWDRGEKRLVAVVWFGGSLSGWPGVTHGGLLATALSEKVSLAGALASGASYVSHAAIPQRLPGTGNHAKMPLPSETPPEPAQMSIDYLKPTYANNFHVIRVSRAYDSQEDVRMPIQGHEYTATLETLDGKTCIKATAKFEARSDLEKAEAKVQDAAQWSYNEFRQWLWPSRQQQSQIG